MSGRITVTRGRKYHECPRAAMVGVTFGLEQSGGDGPNGHLGRQILLVSPDNPILIGSVIGPLDPWRNKKPNRAFEGNER